MTGLLRAPGTGESDWARVHGGAGGTAARLADLRAAAGALDRVAAALGRAAVHATEVSHLVDHAAVWSPATAPAARAWTAPLLSPHQGLLARADQASRTAASLRATVRLYEDADLDVATLLRGGSVAGGAVLGAAGPLAWLATAGLAIVAAGAAVTQVALLRSLRRTPGAAGLLLRTLGSQRVAGSPGALGAIGRALSGPGPLPSALGWPSAGTVEALVPGVGAFVLAAAPGRAVVPPGEPVQAAARSLVGPALAATRLIGAPTTGLLVARVVPANRPEERPPVGIGDVVEDVKAMYPASVGPGGGAPGSVGVQRLDHEDGTTSWVVTVPGTQEWSPLAGPNPMDLTTNLDLVAGYHDDVSELVVRAMTSAGIPAGDAVLLAGHSQGGMVAMGLAQDPAFQERFTVAAVLTAGSPVGGAGDGQLPAGAQALQLEHAQDYVPTLDGEPNPDDPRRTTVQVDLGSVPWSDGWSPLRSPVDAHAVERYAATARAVEGSTAPSVLAFLGGAGRVLGTHGTSPVISSQTERYLGVRAP